MKPWINKALDGDIPLWRRPAFVVIPDLDPGFTPPSSLGMLKNQFLLRIKPFIPRRTRFKPAM